jgi:hypothetical protein
MNKQSNWGSNLLSSIFKGTSKLPGAAASVTPPAGKFSWAKNPWVVGAGLTGANAIASSAANYQENRPLSNPSILNDKQRSWVDTMLNTKTDGSILSSPLVSVGVPTVGSLLLIDYLRRKHQETEKPKPVASPMELE